VLLDRAAIKRRGTEELRRALRGEERGLHRRQLGREQLRAGDELRQLAGSCRLALPMLRGHALTALVLALVLGCAPAFAQVDGETTTPGNTCDGGVTAGHGNRPDWDTIFECNGSTKWQRGPYFLGSTSDTCDSNHAGMVQYTSGTLEACNGTSWIPIDGGMHFISTQTASSSASLQFTNLPTSYNTLFLNCTSLLTSGGYSTIYLYVGESSGPTWETTAHYTEGYYESLINGSGGANYSGDILTSSDVFHGLIGTGTSSAVPISFKAYIDNVGSSSVYKNVTWNAMAGAPSQWFGFVGWSNWNNDTNPITGLEVLPSAGNIASGTCSLYGLN
jgi:hypothetical protein